MDGIRSPGTDSNPPRAGEMESKTILLRFLEMNGRGISGSNAGYDSYTGLRGYLTRD